DSACSRYRGERALRFVPENTTSSKGRQSRSVLLYRRQVNGTNPLWNWNSLADQREKETMNKQRIPKGWTEEKIRKLAEHYDNQTEDDNDEGGRNRSYRRFTPWPCCRTFAQVSIPPTTAAPREGTGTFRIILDYICR